MSVKKIGVVLWILVLVFGAVYIYRNAGPGRAGNGSGGGAAELLPEHDGRAFANIAWKRLPHLKPFRLTEKSGEPFDSRSLAGQPYVLSFFFTRCPTICRDLNRQIARLTRRFRNTDLSFIGLSVDTETDTPEVLREYAAQFDGNPDNWLLLTGQQYKINQIAKQQLNTVVDGDHHTGDIFLIDRWGRFRDRFTWDDPREMKRFAEVAKTVLQETAPPLESVFRTRNMMAGLTHARRNESAVPVPWLSDFQLVDQHGDDFFSRDLTGQVWIASFFFTRCGSVCPRQNAWLAENQHEITGRGARLVSITTDSRHDSPDVLRPYARQINAHPDWVFLTGDFDYIRRVGSEFLGLAGGNGHHSSLLVVVDRWGDVRARVDWQREGARQALLDLIDSLKRETRPPASFEILKIPAAEQPRP